MERFTFAASDGSRAVSESAIVVATEGYSGAAIERLGAFEDAVEAIEAQLSSIEPRLEELKARGRIRSAEAQQLLAQKLSFRSMLHMMGVDD